MSPIVPGAAALAAGAVLVSLLARARRPAPVAAGPHALPRESGACGVPAAGGGASAASAPPDPRVWRAAAVSSLSAAEELLDRAEADGYDERELAMLGASAFVVRWRRRA